MLRLLTAILLLATAPALPAAAKDKGSPGKGKGPPAERGGGGDRDDWRRFTDDDRRWWQDYWHQEYGRGHCPPGLAKKRNGCLPPGQAKKRYAVGRPLPPGVVLVAVPAPLLGRLPPLEPGYRYGMVDGDLVKLAVGTSLVVDAINGLLY
jgi:hypothetical protein